MPRSALVHQAVRPQAWVCRQCQAGPRVPRRQITQGHIRKTIEAEWQWKEQAKEIQAGRKQPFLRMLEERGFVKQIAGDRDVLDKVMTNKRIGAYCGVDPTAPSLHVGHLLPFMVTFWMYLHGFRAVTVLGGGTVKIGDPSGRTTARDKMAAAMRKSNMAQMHIQLKKLWMGVERMGRKHGYVREWAWRRALVNNSEWLSKLSVIEFLKDLGTGVRLGPMLSRDTVKTRQKKGDGMSLAEFTYPILQAWDWWHLMQSLGVQLQVGGQDQFGNIVAGIDAVNYLRHSTLNEETQNKVLDKQQPGNDYLKAPYGLTVPLLTTSSGEKFGKSAGNAIWINPEMTSSFDLYGFWIRTSDADVERYLKLFTFLPLSTISKVVGEHKLDPSKRLAQHLLAREFVDLVHGEIAAERAASQHRLIFGKQPAKPADGPQNAFSSSSASAPSTESIVGHPKPGEASNAHFLNAASGNRTAPQTTYQNAPSLNLLLPRSLVYNNTFPKLLWSAGLVASKSEGYRLVSNEGAYVGSRPGQVGGMGDSLKFTPIKHPEPGLPEKYIYDANQLLIRVGKWKIKVITVIPDAEFAARGLTAPGWDAEKGAPLLDAREVGKVEGNAARKEARDATGERSGR